uniref:F-box domain-containing protein n=1 Tax=Xenopus tropicalis TaxID=8364 RepID=A0A803JIV2_XENTR
NWSLSAPCAPRLACVCRRWYQVASSPDLWARVSIGFCWANPGKRQSPSTQSRIRGTLKWLIQERLSLLSEFSLHHWKEQVPFVVKTLAASCPRLSALTLSHCSGVSADVLVTAARNCPDLLSLNLQNSQVESVLGALGVCGPRLQRLFLTFSSRLSAILSSLTVLRLLNLVWSPKSGGCRASESRGFEHLQELCLATSSYSFVSDSVCQRLLCDSSHLKILDLRGCYRVTPHGICQLPCVDLERLYLGIYCSTKNLALPRTGCTLIARRWQHSLQELDITAQNYKEEDLAQALSILSTGGSRLRSLNLAGTKIMAPALRELLSGCPALSHLDLSSCRYLPRGMKHVYRGEADIRQCLGGLTQDLDTD